MSWSEDIQAYPLVPITTGDGEVYNVKMIFKGGSIDPLTGVFNYAGKVGTKPIRNSSASPTYDLNFFIDQELLKKFIVSISDPTNNWLVKHPLFGDLTGHPTSISFDNTKQGDVLFTIQFQDSIKDETPEITTDFKERILASASELEEQTIDEFSDIEPSTEELNILDKFLDSLEELYDSIMNSDIMNLIYDGKKLIQDVTFASSKFISITNDLMKIPSLLSIDGILEPLKTRLEIIKGQAEHLKNLDVNVSTKSSDGNTSDAIAKFKQLSGSVNLSSLAIGISTPSESQNNISGFDITDKMNVGNKPDYRFKKDVESTILFANQLLDDYITSIDSIDLEIKGNIKFSANEYLNYKTTNIVLSAIQEVKEISNKAKNENFIITKKDTTPELLSFELYGIASDENVQEIIDNNDLFGNNSIANSWRNFVIKKNTKIVYYA